jgi:hypothetical protein
MLGSFIPIVSEVCPDSLGLATTCRLNDRSITQAAE